MLHTCHCNHNDISRCLLARIRQHIFCKQRLCRQMSGILRRHKLSSTHFISCPFLSVSVVILTTLILLIIRRITALSLYPRGVFGLVSDFEGPKWLEVTNQTTVNEMKRIIFPVLWVSWYYIPRLYYTSTSSCLNSLIDAAFLFTDRQSKALQAQPISVIPLTSTRVNSNIKNLHDKGIFTGSDFESRHRPKDLFIIKNLNLMTRNMSTHWHLGLYQDTTLAKRLIDWTLLVVFIRDTLTCRWWISACATLRESFNPASNKHWGIMT